MTDIGNYFYKNELQCNFRYYNNIKEMADVLKDEQVKPLDKAIWNIEHLLKFPKSKHMQYHGREMSNFEYWSTFIFIIAAFSFVTVFIFFILLSASKVIRGRFQNNIIDNDKIRNHFKNS